MEGDKALGVTFCRVPTPYTGVDHDDEDELCGCA